MVAYSPTLPAPRQTPLFRIAPAPLRCQLAVFPVEHEARSYARIKLAEHHCALQVAPAPGGWAVTRVGGWS